MCVGACLLMIVSIHGFGPDTDTARVAAQIVSGVGFLGAGIIIYRKQEILRLKMQRKYEMLITDLQMFSFYFSLL